MSQDPYTQFKAAQREGWALFSPLAAYTTPPAAQLVDYAGVQPGQAVLDLACGTGVVAVTAAQRGAKVRGLDLSPALVAHARENAALAEVAIEFLEGDAEALPYPDASFDVVLSQFGHIFAPRPERVTQEMLRVLKPGGRIAFSTWPPELLIGRSFALVAQYLPPPAGLPPPGQWGDPQIVRQRLGDAVQDLQFDRGEMWVPALSAQHYRHGMEQTAAPMLRLVSELREQPQLLGEFRAQLDALAAEYWRGNRVLQGFLLSRARKR